jgi:hypothetical protein
MGLSFAQRQIEGQSDVSLVNYAEYLERHPATWEAQIHEDSSWSCVHGVERWRADCGCNGGRGPGWNQKWRQPLREALDWLRDEVAPRYEQLARELFRDPWEARDRYIDVVLDRSEERVSEFFDAVAARPLEQSERAGALELLELQRHAMLMYTSCGWFFDDISGIETVQVLAYAGRVVQLAQELFGFEPDLEAEFLGRLVSAVSNIPERANGRDVYLSEVVPAKVDLRKAGAHFAVSSIFDELPPDTRIYSFRFERRDEQRHESGKEKLIVGHVRVSSMITEDSEELSYAVLHLGNHNVVGGVRLFRGQASYQELSQRLTSPFRRTDFTAVIRVLDREFEASTYSLRSLFRDAQRLIVDQILEASVEDAEEHLTRLYEQRAPLLRFLHDLQIPQPRPFKVAGEYVLNTRLQRILRQAEPKLLAIQATLEQVHSTGVLIETREVSFAARRALERMAERLEWEPKEPLNLRRLREMAELVLQPPLSADPWRVQNVFYRVVREQLPEIRARAARGRADAQEWIREAEWLGELLRVALPPAPHARESADVKTTSEAHAPPQR